MNHTPLFIGPESLHLQIRVIGYVIALAMIVLVMVGIERAQGNGGRWPLRLLIWPMAAVTVASLLIAEVKTQGIDLTDMLIYTTWFKVLCLMAFWTIAQRKKH